MAITFTEEMIAETQASAAATAEAVAAGEYVSAIDQPPSMEHWESYQAGGYYALPLEQEQTMEYAQERGRQEMLGELPPGVAAPLVEAPVTQVAQTLFPPNCGCQLTHKLAVTSAFAIGSPQNAKSRETETVKIRKANKLQRNLLALNPCPYKPAFSPLSPCK